MNSTRALIAIAVLLMIAWVVLRVALAITSGLLHLLWIVAVILFVMWAWGKMKSGLGRKNGE